MTHFLEISTILAATVLLGLLPVVLVLVSRRAGTVSVIAVLVLAVLSLLFALGIATLARQAGREDCAHHIGSDIDDPALRGVCVPPEQAG